MPNALLPQHIPAQTLLSALADRTRLGALHILWDGQEHCVCELMEALHATQSRMSRHMKTLKDAGLLVDRRDAQWMRYRLAPNLSQETRDVLKATLTLDCIQQDKPHDL